MEMTARLGLKVSILRTCWTIKKGRNGDDSPVGIESGIALAEDTINDVVEMEMTARLGLKVSLRY